MKWSEHFLAIAEKISEKSKDPSTKVGCVIVTHDNRSVSWGYNGFIAECTESFMTYEKPMKYALTCHAEMNAIIFARQDLEHCKLFTTHSPCEDCLKYILQARFYPGSNVHFTPAVQSVCKSHIPIYNCKGGPTCNGIPGNCVWID